MRKLLSVVFVGLCVSANARQITSDEAISVVSEFFNSSYLQAAQSANSALRPMKAPGMDANSVTNPFYIFNRGENDGFVIISGDDRAPKILGYSDKGSFDAENLPPQLKGMMEVWAKQMNSLPNIGQHASWKKASATRAGEGVLLETAEWGQGYPYNALCPMIDGVHAQTGCVATAMAIAMKYHNWPDCSRGGEETDFYHPELTFNFSDYSIDWNSLADKGNSKFNDEVAKLSLSAGIASTMSYGSEVSSADVWPIGHALMQYYAYDKDCQYVERKEFTDEAWKNMLQTQLEEVGPVIYRGGASDGHCFVIDGYNSEGLYHVNWGWDGQFNGYFTIDFSDVNNMSFEEYQGMIINMKPDKDKKEYSKLWIANINTYVDDMYGQKGWNFSSSDIVPGEPVTVKLPVFTENKFIGYFRLAVVDSNDKIISFVDDKYIENTYYGNWCAHPGFTVWFKDVVFPPLKEGERYQIVSQEVSSSVYGHLDESTPSENPEDYLLVLGGMLYPSHFTDKGNRSEYGEVNFHVEGSLPLYFQEFNTWDKEFTIKHLLGIACASPFCGPQEEYTVEVMAFDANGDEQDGDFVAGGNEDAIGSYTISVYTPRVEVYIRPDLSIDTRRDWNLKKSEIIDADGLIYRINGEEATLIGYDRVPEHIEIPDMIVNDEKKYTVTEIADKALLYAPAKTLTLKSNSLNKIGSYSFAAMDNLESISIEGNMNYDGFDFGFYSFMKSNLKDIYSTQLMHAYFLPNALSINRVYFTDLAPLYTENVDCWVSILPQDNSYAIPLHMQRIYEEEGEEMLRSYNIPGLGGTSLCVDYEYFGMKEMWQYNVDFENGIVQITDLVPEVEIDRVEINGEEVTCDEYNLYPVPDATRAEGLDVKVDYTIKSTKKMSTHYTPEYNQTVTPVTLATSVESSIIESGLIEIYNINGVVVNKTADKETLKQMEPGVYVMRQGKEVKKIVIR